MARVFSAIDITDEKLLQELEDVRNRIDLGFSPVEKQKMHITLEFFEDIDQDEIETLKQKMKNIDSESFKTKVSGLGCFPSNDYIRVVWADIEEKDGFHRLYSQLSNHSIESDNKHEFKPHITMLRVQNIGREEKKKLRKTIREFEDYRFGSLNVDKIKLFRSDLNPKGSEYTKLFESKL